MTITVQPQNDPPTAQDQSAATNEDTPLDITLTGDGYDQDVVPAAAMFDVEQGVVGGRAVTGGGLGDAAIPHRWTVPATSHGAGEPDSA